jgi:hypothetical protein
MDRSADAIDLSGAPAGAPLSGAIRAEPICIREQHLNSAVESCHLEREISQTMWPALNPVTASRRLALAPGS